MYDICQRLLSPLFEHAGLICKRLQYKQEFKELSASMLNLHRRVFADDQNNNLDESRQIQEQSHNKRVLRKLFVTSPLSCIMMAIIIVMFLLCQLTDVVNYGKYNFSVISASTLIKYGANANAYVNQGQYWRLISAIFLHSGMMHLLANSTSFFLYLMPVEQKLRSNYNAKQWLCLYSAVLLYGGMMGNILSVNVHNVRNQDLVAVGASSAISSVIGFDIMYRALRVNGQPMNSRRMLITLGYMFIISIMPGVDFYGHFGSLLGGALLGACVLKPSQQHWSNHNAKMIKISAIVALSAYTASMMGLLFRYYR